MRALGFEVHFSKFDFYFFVFCNMTALNIRATMKRRTEATYGPPIPATYDSPTQNVATETTSTNIQTKAIIKCSLSIVFHLLFVKFSTNIICFCKKSFPQGSLIINNTYANLYNPYSPYSLCSWDQRPQALHKKSFRKKKIDYVYVSARMTIRKMNKMRLSYNYIFKYSDTLIPVSLSTLLLAGKLAQLE